MRKQQKNPVGGYSTEYLPVLLKSVKVMKNKERLTNCHGADRLGGHGNHMQCGSPDWILQEKQGLSGKTCEI